MKEALPYTEEVVEHQGWNTYCFQLLGRDWRLTTIDNGREPARSLLNNNAGTDDPWPSYDIMQLDGIVSVQACASIIHKVYNVFNLGKRRGENKARAEIRAALDIR